MTQTEKKDKTIPILNRIDKNTAALLDAFSRGITASVVSKVVGSIDKKTRTRRTQSGIKTTVGISDKSTSQVINKPVVNQNIKIATAVLPEPKKIQASAIQPISAPQEIVKALPKASPVIPNVKKTKAALPEKAQKAIETQPVEAIKRNKKGQFEKSKSQQAFDDQKQNGNTAAGHSNEDIPAGKVRTLLDRLLGAGAEVAHNADAKETAGLAVFGPMAGAVSELASLGGSLKDTVTGVVDKLRGDKSGGKGAGEAQVAATEEVKAAVNESDAKEEWRHNELIKAIKGKSRATATAYSSGKSKPSKTEQKGGGGMLSGLFGMLTGGAGAIGAMLMAAAPVILTVAGSLAGLYMGKKAYDDYNDTQGQQKDLNLKDNEKASPLQKTMYALMGGKHKEIDVDKENLKEQVAQFRKEKGLKEDEPLSVLQKIDILLHRKSDPERYTINPDGSSKKKGKEPENNILTMLQKAEKTMMEGIAASIIGGGTGIEAEKTISADGLPTAMKSSHIPDMTMPAHTGLGSLSARYESGGDPGKVNDNDVGKAAYGTYQMRGDTAENFVKNSKWAKNFEGLKQGTPEFKAQWKSLGYGPEKQDFAAAQHDSIKQTHYDPLAAYAKTMGLDTSSPAMQDVLWSTGVQHGAEGGRGILDKAFTGAKPSDFNLEDSISRIYNERGRMGADGNLAHFPKARGNTGLQESLLNRFGSENKNALSMASASAATNPIQAAYNSIAQPATPIQPPAPTIAPISPPKPEPQQVVVTGGGGSGQSAQPSGQAPEFRPASSRPGPFQQPRKMEPNIKMDFDDSILTLLIYDRM